MDTEQVSIVKAKDNLSSAVIKSIELIGGIDSVIKKGDIVILKPNFVAPRRADTGVTTNLEIIKAIADEVKKCNAKPILYEFPGMEYDFENIYNFLGLDDFSRKNEIYIYKKQDEFIKKSVSKGGKIKNIKIPKILLKAKLINIPELKAHGITKISAGMKNLMGLLPNEERSKMHAYGIDQSIVDVNKIIKPCLTIVDATIVMEGDAVYGNKVNLNMVISGKDVLSVDNVCCMILGVDSNEIKHVKLANREFGNKAIQILGDLLEQTGHKFRMPNRSFLYKFAYRLMYVIDIPFSRFYSVPFNKFLYSTGFIGTRVKINKDKCDKCMDRVCIAVCPIKDAISLSSYRVNGKKCIRCLKCFDVCPNNAIVVKGFSKPQKEDKNEK